MAVESKVYGGFLYQRKIDKLVGGAVIDWDSGPMLKRIEIAIAEVNTAAAKRIEKLAKVLVPKKSGDLRDTIKAYPSKFQYSGSVGLKKQVYSEWVISAGSVEVDYAAHVELGWGRHERDTTGKHKLDNEGKKIFMYAAQGKGYMRKAAANTRKWTRKRMINALKRAIDGTPNTRSYSSYPLYTERKNRWFGKGSGFSNKYIRTYY